MYLTKKTYIFRDCRSQLRVTGIDQHIDPNKVESITEEVGYWRKANAVHQWFVDNVQGGEDDCKEYWVDQSKLSELLDIVNTVLDASELVDGKIQNGTLYQDGKAEPIIEDGKYIQDPTTAKRLLPTQSGFFFGSTHYDQWYYEDLERTKEILTTALDMEDGDFYYQSSW